MHKTTTKMKRKAEDDIADSDGKRLTTVKAEISSLDDDDDISDMEDEDLVIIINI